MNPKKLQAKGCSLRTRKYANLPQQLEVRQDEISNAISGMTKDYLVMVFKDKEKADGNSNR